jgi:TolB-like protein/DNA-binding winged helix-turn-helix (wHTH) protein/tetratricopeptide (TPR) repeat protein
LLLKKSAAFITVVDLPPHRYYPHEAIGPVGGSRMDVSVRDKGVYVFGPFRLDPVRRTLSRDRVPIKLAARLFDTLLYLIEAQGRLVEKDELLAAVWPGRIVEEGNLPQTISILRKTLQTDATGEGYIVTAAGRGYRFAAPVVTERDAPDTSTVSVAASAPTAAIATTTPAFAPSKLPWWRDRAAPLLAGLILCVSGFTAVQLLPPHGDSAPKATADFAPPPHSVAVLAFTNMSGDPSQEYFSDGLAEELIDALGRIDGMHVAARVSAFSFKGKPATIAEIARTLNVGAVLEGSVRRQADRLRVTVQLIDARTGFQYWSRSYDRAESDRLNMQTEIATAVIDSLQITLQSGQAERLATGDTTNAAAFDASLRSFKLASPAIADFQGAIAAADEAIRLDPGYATAYMNRSYARYNLAANMNHATWPQLSAMYTEALKDADKAVSLAPDTPGVHDNRALILEWGFQDFAQAIAEDARAVELGPGQIAIKQNYGYLEILNGNVEDGVRVARDTALVETGVPTTYTFLATSLFFAHRYDEAERALRREQMLTPKLPDRDQDLRCDIDLALKKPQAVLDHCGDPHTEFQTEYLAISYQLLGKSDLAQAEMTKLRTMLGEIGTFNYAETYAQWGQPDEAMRNLEISWQNHDQNLAFLRSDPLLDPLRGLPQFKDLERRLHVLP